MEFNQKKVIYIVCSLLIVVGIITGAWFLFKSDEQDVNGGGQKPPKGPDGGDRGGDRDPEKPDLFEFEEVDSFEKLADYMQQFTKKHEANFKYLSKSNKECEKTLNNQKDQIMDNIQFNIFNFINHYNISKLQEVKEQAAEFNQTYQQFLNETKKLLVTNITNYNETLNNFTQIKFNLQFDGKDDHYFLKSDHFEILELLPPELLPPDPKKKNKKGSFFGISMADSSNLLKQKKMLQVLKDIQANNITDDLNFLDEVKNDFQKVVNKTQKFIKKFVEEREQLINQYQEAEEKLGKNKCWIAILYVTNDTNFNLDLPKNQQEDFQQKLTEFNQQKGELEKIIQDLNEEFDVTNSTTYNMSLVNYAEATTSINFFVDKLSKMFPYINQINQKLLTGDYDLNIDYISRIEIEDKELKKNIANLKQQFNLLKQSVNNKTCSFNCEQLSTALKSFQQKLFDIIKGGKEQKLNSNLKHISTLLSQQLDKATFDSLLDQNEKFKTFIEQQNKEKLIKELIFNNQKPLIIKNIIETYNKYQKKLSESEQKENEKEDESVNEEQNNDHLEFEETDLEQENENNNKEENNEQNKESEELKNKDKDEENEEEKFIFEYEIENKDSEKEKETEIEQEIEPKNEKEKELDKSKKTNQNKKNNLIIIIMLVSVFLAIGGGIKMYKH